MEKWFIPHAHKSSVLDKPTSAALRAGELALTALIDLTEGCSDDKVICHGITIQTSDSESYDRAKRPSDGDRIIQNTVEPPVPLLLGSSFLDLKSYGRF